jgi:hypothetical protein
MRLRFVFGLGPHAGPLRCAALVFVLAQSAALPAAAQVEDAYETRPPAVTPVYQLPRPSYDSPKIMLGSFLLAPSFTETMAGNDNIFANDRHLVSDLIVTTAEDLSIRSQWLSDSVSLHAYHSHEWYTGHVTENANTYGLEGGFRFDVTKNAAVELSTGIEQQPQLRNSPQADRQSLTRPLYNTIPVSMRYTQDWGRWHNSFEAGFIQTAYIRQADDSRSAIQARYHDRLSFALSGVTWSFLQLSYSAQDWKLNPGRRNFDTFSALGGLNVQIEDLVDVELGAGVLRQGYNFSSFDDLVTPIFSGRLNWNISPLTTLSASANRTVTGLETFCDTVTVSPACTVLSGGALTALASQRGALEVSSAEVGIQHEFWHNLLGQVRFRFEQDKFDPVDLVDRNFAVNLGGRILVNRNMELDISYDLNIRTANQNILLYNSGPYQANMVSLALKAAM